MDVITTALTAAIADGSASAAYQMLKSRLAGKSPRVDEAIADLEQDPGSLSRQFAVSDALAAAGLAGDRYLRAAARNLVDEVDRRRTSRPPALPADQPNHAVLQVFFATDRQPTADRHPARQFSAARGELGYGSCEVSVPRDGTGDDATLPTLVRMHARPAQDGHAVLLRSEVAPRDAYLAALGEAAARAGGGVLVFVHGYRTSFEDAARRAARIAYALRFAGVPVLYSWPSQGRLSGYAVDETNAEWTRPALARFLAELADRTGAAPLFLLAHGMGARALGGALADLLAARPEVAPRLRQVILAAPDIDTDVFQGDIAPALANAGIPIALYASSADDAMADAVRARAAPRAGQSGATLVVAPGIETIDASGVDTSFIGRPHAQAPSVLDDIRHLLGVHAATAGRPGLRAVDAPAGRHWVFNG
jgi:esterase/lipase superfamily enzyme